MERFLTLLVASLCAAPLFYFLVSGIVFVSNKGASGDSGMAVAYLGVWGGFLAAFAGFFLVWFLARYFLVENYLRYLQIFDGVALVGWFVLYMSWSDKQDYRLEYPDRRAVVMVEVRSTRSFLNGKTIDSQLTPQLYGQNLDIKHPDQIREEGDFVILPWETTPISLKSWEVWLFVNNKRVSFPLDLPKRPSESTEWSGWMAPSATQEEPLPAGVLQNVAIRYRFRLIPYGSQE
jgi:hypothetical protein